jgi:3-oxocholest-4-en-26-oyl-CoA dehydrogenase alpha subunit
MDFSFTAEQESFRTELREFIRQELPSTWGGLTSTDAEDWEQARRFQRALGSKKWLAMAWPVEYGGTGADTMTQLIYREETGYRGTPRFLMGPAFSMGVAWVGPAIISYGTEEQRRRFLPGMASGRDYYCTLYSEPGSGSDLASITTKAVKDGTDYVISGQKIWTSSAHLANWGWLAARTNSDAPKHGGISTFVIPMDSPGITIRPILNMAGHHGFNEVFFDQVRVSESHLIGERDQGWRNLSAALDLERSGIEWNANARRRLDDILEFVRNDRQIRRSPALRYELAQRVIEVETGRLMCYRVAYRQSQGKNLNYEASVAKIFNSELIQRVASTAMKALAAHGIVDGTYGELAVQPSHNILEGYLLSVACTIGAGSNEIQRNILARSLGLPRQVRAAGSREPSRS